MVYLAMQLSHERLHRTCHRTCQKAASSFERAVSRAMSAVDGGPRSAVIVMQTFNKSSADDQPPT